MEHYFCYICGNKLSDRFVAGEICSCCHNEAGFDDDILKSELDDKFIDVDFVQARINKKDLMQYEKIPVEIAYQLLRAKWINGGCIWHNKDKQPDNWNLDKAKEQMKNCEKIKI
jgi:hypothetical protein